jgi:hypothetical protein
LDLFFEKRIQRINGRVFRRYHVRNNPVNWIDSSGLCTGDKETCIDNFLKNNYGDFATLIPKFSLISLFTNTSEFLEHATIELGGHVALAGIPKLASEIYTITGTNLAAYPGRVGAALDALEAGAFWATTAATVETVSILATTGIFVFSSTADAYARLKCWDVQ